MGAELVIHNGDLQHLWTVAVGHDATPSPPDPIAAVLVTGHPGDLPARRGHLDWEQRVSSTPHGAALCDAHAVIAKRHQ